MGALLLFLALLVAVVSAIRGVWSPCGLSMLSSITPMTEAGRRNRFRTTAVSFVVGGVLGGLILGAVAAGGRERAGRSRHPSDFIASRPWVTFSAMCGRFVSSSPPDEIARYFDAEAPAEAALEPSYNVAPTSDVYVVLEDGGVRQVAAHHWGLVPVWAKSPGIGNKMINARAEGLAAKNAFKHAFRKRRCLVPADGFYEWRKVPGEKTKQPYFIHRADDEPLAFAGLWEEWKGPEKDGTQRLRSATIITTTPNELMATLHDRMPVILPPSAWEEWLNTDPADDAGLETLAKLLVPAPDGILAMHPVSKDVGNVRNRGAHLTEPVNLDQPLPLNDTTDDATDDT